jgi:hypothetical protein
MSVLDFIVGKKDPGKAPDPISEDIKRAQTRATLFQEKILDDHQSRILDGPSVEDEARQDTDTQLNFLQGERGDANRRLQELMAQRGLGPGTSSVSRGLYNSQENDFNERADQIRASVPARIRQLREERAGQTVGLGSRVLASQNAPIDFYGRQPERSGGILPLLTGAAGGMMGGYGGFAAGVGAGQYLQGQNNSRYR